jgi:hypothetical protein
MAVFLFANNATTTLAAPISSSATSLTLSTGTGALFPNPTAGQQFEITLNDAATGEIYEILYCTARSGDVLTVVRAQEGTTAVGWNAGDIAAQFVTAGQMQAMVQTLSLYPARIVTLSGVFTMTTADANGGVGLNRTSSLSASSTTLPSGAQAGQSYAIEDLAGNLQTYNCTVNAPAGMTIAGLSSFVMVVNRQCAYFRYYGSNIWSVKA